MATYKDIQADVLGRYGRSIKTCWIADVKASHGLTSRVASNRVSLERREYPCPSEVRPLIEDSMRRLGMI
jgi:hypothetical protein